MLFFIPNPISCYSYAHVASLIKKKKPKEKLPCFFFFLNENSMGNPCHCIKENDLNTLLVPNVYSVSVIGP